MIRYMHRVLALDLEEWYQYGIGTGWVTDRFARSLAHDWVYGFSTRPEFSTAGTYNIL